MKTFKEYRGIIIFVKIKGHKNGKEITVSRRRAIAYVNQVNKQGSFAKILGVTPIHIPKTMTTHSTDFIRY